jgi:alkylhydroperoxidase family enzyme
MGKHVPRIRELELKNMPVEFTDQVKQIFGDQQGAGTMTGTPGNWWTTWARVPGILRAFSAYSIRTTPLDKKLLEIALIRTGYTRSSQFVFSQHCKSARRAGVEEEKIKAIPYWTLSDVFLPAERAVLAFADGLILESGRVHDRVMEAIKAHLSEEEILMLTYFINMYSLHAISGRALRLEYDDIPERIVEIPAPESRKIQDWLSTSWANGRGR